MKPLSRRDFLRATGSGAALLSSGLTSPRSVRAATVKGANDRIRVAVIGVKGRGKRHLEAWSQIPNVEVATICDIDTREYGPALAEVAKHARTVPTMAGDMRRVFDDKSIDFVSIATPDHWHALATIWACQAGKDVYTEKPTCHNIWEGRRMVEAARKYNRVVAAGTQNRSIPAVQAAMKFLHDGGIGDVYMAKGLCFKPRDSIGKKPDGPIPGGVDYDMWLGPAPKRAYNENRFHYTWHWFWDYGCADLGNQGPHQMDVARWGMGRSDYPSKIHCSGGYYAFDSDQQTPNTQVATMEFADGKLLQFEARGLYTNAEDGLTIGNLFYGTKGWMHVNGAEWKTFFGRKNEPGPSSKGGGGPGVAANPGNLKGEGDGPHFEMFIKALRSRNPADLTADIEEGHRSSSYCHLANIAYRVGRQVRFDGKTETFIGDSEASALLSRKYRAPFAVPHKV